MSTATYVIKSWKINPSAAAPDEPRVEIHGRTSGLVSWFLNLVKISPTVTFKVLGDKILFEEGSFSGYMDYVTPLTKTSSLFYGYAKPWIAAVAIFVVVAGLLSCINPIVGVIAGIVAGLLYYFLNKQLVIGYTDVAGTVHSFSFKRSVVEGQNISEKNAAEVTVIIQTLVDAAK